LTVTVGAQVPAVVFGVPLILPVVPLMDRPGGSPVAVIDCRPVFVVMAICRLTAFPRVDTWLGGVPTVSVGLVVILQPAPLLLHRLCIANVPVDSLMSP